jgi:hypothetical protein
MISPSSCKLKSHHLVLPSPLPFFFVFFIIVVLSALLNAAFLWLSFLLLPSSEDSLYSFLGLSSYGEVLAFAAFNDAPYVPGAVSGKKAANVKSWAMDMSSNHGFRVRVLDFVKKLLFDMLLGR